MGLLSGTNGAAARGLPRNAVSDIRIRLEERPVANLLIEELVNVQSHHLSLLANTQMHVRSVLQNEEDDAGNHKAVRGDGRDLSELFSNLDTVAVDASCSVCRAVEHADGVVREDARQEGADDAANAVELEDLQALVDANPFVEILHASTHDCGNEPNISRKPDTDIASGWRDADQSSNDTFAGPDNAELAAGADKVHDDPANGSGRGRHVGVECSVHGTDASIERGATIETEPSHPNQHYPEEHKSSVVGLLVRGLSSMLTLAQDQGIGKTLIGVSKLVYDTLRKRLTAAPEAMWTGPPPA